MLNNRIVMAPMTRGFALNGVPNNDIAEYYAKRAAADVGLIITEGTTIDREAASNDPNVPNFYTPESLDGWQQVADSVHEVKGKIAPQLWHVGMMRDPKTSPFPEAMNESPSGIDYGGSVYGDALTDSQIGDIINAYAKAAAEAKQLGFDAIEIHGGHGYLIDQFFWAAMNKRMDKYGGDYLERTRFAAEVITACRQAVGPDMVINLRFSQFKQQAYSVKLTQTPQELEAFLSVLVDAGVDMFHCSQRRYWQAEFPEVDGEEGLSLAGWTKKLSGQPSISVGSVGLSSSFSSKEFQSETSKTRPLSDVIERLDRGEFDLIAVGRALLQDPYWAQKVRAGKLDELQPYNANSLSKLY